jgi:hypothetical protein
MTTPKIYKTYYDIDRLVIWGDETNDPQVRRARLVLSFRDGNPRITVYTGQKSASGVISFPCEAVHVTTIFNYLKEIANSEPGTKITVDSLTTKYTDNKPTNELDLVSTLHIGKSKEGIVYISVISENKPKIVFSIKPSRFHIFRDAEKNIIPESVISSKMAVSIAELALNVVSQAILQYTNEQYDFSGKTAVPINGQSQPAPHVTTTSDATFDELGI